MPETCNCNKEISEITTQIKQMRDEMKIEFDEQRRWRSNMDIATKGLDQEGIWGYKQKIEHNRRLLAEMSQEFIETKAQAQDRFQRLERKIERMVGFALGVGSIGGTTAAIIFNLLTKSV